MVGAEDVLGEKATSRRIAWALEGFALNEILDLAGRISACLATDRTGQRTQMGIANALIGLSDVATLGARLDRHVANQDAQGWVLFSEQQLINLVKFALLVVEEDDLDRPMPPLFDFFRALLMMTDYTTNSAEEGRGLDEPEGRIRYIVANGLFGNEATTLQNLVYSHDIYLTDEDVDRVKRVTGVEPKLYWAVGHALHATMAAISVDNVKNRGASVRASDYFTSLGYTGDESERLVNLFSTSLDELRDAVRDRYSVDDLREFDFLPLSKQPLVRIGDHAFCPSLRLLQAKVTDGLRHLSLDPTVTTERERALYLTSLGGRFEQFVDQHLAALPQSTDRFVSEAELRRLAGGSLSRADALLISGDSVLILEAKASALRLEARIGEDFTALEAWLNKTLVRGVVQTWRTAAWINEKGRAKLGLDPDTELHFVPVVLTLEEVPTSVWLYEWVIEKLEGEGDAPPGCGPPQFLTVSDLTLLESVSQAFNQSVTEVLRRRSDDELAVRIPFMNYLHASHPAQARKTAASTVTSARFKILTDEILATLRNGLDPRDDETDSTSASTSS